jgi:transposase
MRLLVWTAPRHLVPDLELSSTKTGAVFTLHCLTRSEGPAVRLNLKRPRLIPFLRKLPPTEVVMEACASAHHWGRTFASLGHSVRLIPPQHVKPFVKRGKNDRNDAEAISEAAARPNIHPVPVKSAEQQAQAMVLKVRDTLVGQRTQLVNTLRGHAAEFGVIAAKGLSAVDGLLKAIEVETTIPLAAKEMLAVLGEEIAHLDARLEELDAKLLAAHKANPVSQLLAGIPGIGPVTALTLATEIADRRSRAQRWRDAVAALTALQTEYAAWLEALPDNLSDGATAETLSAICELDLSELQAIEPPRGFGRD